MKLHLPSPLRSALLACLAVVGSMSVSIGTGALATGVVAYAVVGSHAEGAALVNKTFVQDGVIYSGAELVTLDVSNTANVAAGGDAHTIGGVANMTVTLDIDGTPTDKKFNEGVHVLNSSGKGDTNKDYAIWQDFCSTKAYYGQTLKLQGASDAWTLNLDFMPMSYGGLITEAASDAGSYRIGRTDGALNITANTAAGANMLINAATTLVSNGAMLNTSGSWVLNKDLTFASATTLAAGRTIALSGAGALNIDGALTMNAGARITGAQNALAINGCLTLDVNGLTAGAEAFISAAGDVSASELSLSNYTSLARGEYQLIRTTDEAANAISALFSSNALYRVSNKNGVVTLTVGNILTLTAQQSGNQELRGYDGVVFRNITSLDSNDNVGAIINTDTFVLSDNGAVIFSENTASSSSAQARGGAIYNAHNTIFTLSGNGEVTFSDNSALSTSYSAQARGGAICNSYATFTLGGNGDVTFSGNSVSATSVSPSTDAYGGAICNDGWVFIGDYAIFTLSDNGAVTFRGNSASSSASAGGGAISNMGSATFTLKGNGDVSFLGNSASVTSSYAEAVGGAILNSGAFLLSGNGEVTFSGNSVTATSTSHAIAYGGAIYNGSDSSFSLNENGNVLFEKNAEICNNIYRLRSIYSEGTLNLSSSEGKSIQFNDSVYAQGEVNLNLDGTGDIIFTGESTEADLREVKGGIAGTAEEILNSRTSEIATNATLYGGRLMVEDEAILKVKSLSVAEGARVVVKDGTLALNNGNATITTAAGAEKAVLAGASLGESSLAGADAEHRGTVDGAHIDLAEGTDFSMQHLVLSATTRITDAPATLQLDDVTAELVMGVNASLTGSDLLLAGTSLTESGNTGAALTLAAGSSVVMLEATTFDSVTLTGTSLVLELAGMDVEIYNGTEWIGISFTSGTDYATFDPSLAVTLSIDGVCYETGYTIAGDDGPTTMYFRGGKELSTTPEPATATLSLLALAALAARRKRK